MHFFNDDLHFFVTHHSVCWLNYTLLRSYLNFKLEYTEKIPKYWLLSNHNEATAHIFCTVVLFIYIEEISKL